MKKNILFLVITFSLISATDREKLDKLTNFNNYKTYKINFDTKEFKKDEFYIKSSNITNGLATFTIKAILFKGDEGKLENLTRAEIEALPEGPYKFLQWKRYANEYSSDFDRDIAHIYHSDIRESVRKPFYGTNSAKYYEVYRNYKIKKLLMVFKRSDDKLVIFYERHIVKKDGSIYRKGAFYKYSMNLLTKENGKWVVIPVMARPVESLVWRWAWLAYQKEASLGSGSSDENATFFDAFKEVE